MKKHTDFYKFHFYRTQNTYPVFVIVFLFLISSHLWPQTGTTTVWLEDFAGLADGAKSDNGATAWTSTYSGSTGQWKVVSGQFEGQYLVPQAVWKSQVIDISALSGVVVSMDVTGKGTLNIDEDYFRACYILDGGSETSFISYNQDGAFGPARWNSPALNGNTLQIVVRAYNTWSDEIYCFDNVRLQAQTNASTVWLEDFAGLADGTKNDNGTTAWTSTYSGSTGQWKVVSGQFEGQYLVPQAVWKSQVIDISALSGVVVSMDVTGKGTLNINEDYFRACYILNGGSETSFISYNQDGAFGPARWNSPALRGNTLQIVVRAYNTWSDEFYCFDNVRVTGTVPCHITACASAGGILTCANPSVTLSGGSDTTGVTYSWSGPDDFTSAAQNPAVSKPGTYTLTVSNGECSGTAVVTVLQNIAAPDLTAAGGVLPGSGSITLSACSSVPDAVYSWTGPDNFTSDSQNPIVTKAGSYTVTVRNPVNGCTAAHTVQVAAGTTDTLWLEDFAGLADGTKSDNGATAWTSTYSGSTGQWKVASGQFEGQYLVPQAVWKSQVIDISALSGVVVSMDVTGKGTLNINEDYFRACYILDGGSETSFISYNQDGAFGPVRWNSPALRGNTLQIVVRAYNTWSDEFYCFDNVRLQAQANTATAWLEDFAGLADGTKNDNGATAWTSTYSGSTGQWEVVCGQFEGQYLLSQAVWKSRVIDISALSGVVVSMDVTGKGTLNINEDYFRAYYILDGGSETSFISYNQDGAFGPVRWNSPGLNGNTLQIVVRAYNTWSDEFYCFNNVRVTGTAPCHITAYASAGGILTCVNPSVTLSGSSDTVDATYSWSGPDDFTSAAQNPAVSKPGTYTLTVSNGECSGTAVVTVIQNISAPDLTAAGGVLSESGYITLAASSSVSGAIYSWTGPDDFISTLQNPVVSTAGSYTVSVRNPVNGCITCQTVQVTF